MKILYINRQLEQQKIAEYLWSMVLLKGIFVGLLGLVLFAFPRAIMPIMITVVGAWWLADGIATLIQSLRGRRFNAIWVLGIATGPIGIIGGLIIVLYSQYNPIREFTAFVLIFAIIGFIYGLNSTILGWRLLQKGHQESSMLFSGVFCMFFSLMALLFPYLEPNAFARILGVVAFVEAILLTRQGSDLKEHASLQKYY